MTCLSVNSRLAAVSGSSPSAISPFGIVHAPRSFFIQKGPPGCPSRTSVVSPTLRKRRMPALWVRDEDFTRPALI